MLVKNLTKQTLKIRAKNTRVVILPLATVYIDDNLITKEQIKAIYGRYVMFPVEKATGDLNAKLNVLKKTKENLAPKEDTTDVQSDKEVVTVADEKGEDNGNEANVGGADTEDASDDVDIDDAELDKLVDEVLAGVEEEVDAEEAEEEAKKTTKKKKGRKAKNQ